MFKTYDSEIKNLLNSNSSTTNWATVLVKHKEMISIIQHERMIHLLVTVFVGLSFCLFSLAALVTKEAILVLLVVPLLILFVAYIFHYRYLENTTQNWYLLSNKIVEKISE